MMPRFIIFILIIILYPGFAISGTLKGKITYSAEIKLTKSFQTGKYKKACGPEVPNEKLLVNNNETLKEKSVGMG